MILDMLDEAEKEARRVDQVKALLVTTSAEKVADQFPEYFRADPFEQAYTPDGEFDIDRVDPAAIDWQVASPEEDADISAWIEQQERKSGGLTTFTADDDWT